MIDAAKEPGVYYDAKSAFSGCMVLLLDSLENNTNITKT